MAKTKAERKAAWKSFWGKVGSFFMKVGKALFVWGKPIIRKEVNNVLAPKLKAMLKDKINAGAVDKHVDKLIDVGVDAALVEFNKKL